MLGEELKLFFMIILLLWRIVSFGFRGDVVGVKR